MNKITLCQTLVLMMIFGYSLGQEIKSSKKYSKEINKLSKSKKVQSAFEQISELDSWTMENLITLTEIPAAPFMETERAMAFKTMLEGSGADSVWIDEVGNVLAMKYGNDRSRTVALDAHIDTVFPIETDVNVKTKGDSLFAPGIGDDTRGLAMVITVLRSIAEANIKTNSNIVFVGSVGEEGLGNLRGVRYLFEKSNIKIDSWISIDGGSVGRINNKALGSERYKVVFKGPGGHSWGAFGLVNPHHAAAIGISKFNERALDYTSEGPKTSFNVGRIGGGTSVNSIPFESWMEVDMRSVSAKRLNQIDSIFVKSMNDALAEYNDMINIGEPLTLELINIGSRPSGELSIELPLIQRAIAATQYFDIEPRLTRGSTNSNIPISKGIPAITIGRGGNGGASHSLNEWWMNDNGADAIKLALLILLAEAEIIK